MITDVCPRCGKPIAPEAKGLCIDCLVADVELDPGSLPETQTVSAEAVTDDLVDVEGYRLVKVLGSGGMGLVYLAAQEQPVRRPVALKLIKLGMDSREIVARFEGERQALAMMSHPNIAQVFDAGITADGRPYFVMEYVPGEPITDYCDRHRLTTSERLRLFAQVCETIQHAHQKAVIHRDIKPSNILVMVRDDQAVPKVIDFGVAKAIDHRLSEKTVVTEQGQIIGTPEYMSPEQAEMGALDIDTRTDIYSLGVLLYELLIGVLPFDSTELRRAGLAGIQRIIREKEPVRPSTRLTRADHESSVVAEKRRTELPGLIRELRGDLDWITMKALEKDRTRRYASASELRADVERFLRDEPVLARPPSLVYRTRKFARRNRAALSGLVMAGVALLVLFLLTSGYFRAEQSRRSVREYEEGVGFFEKYLDLEKKTDELRVAWKEEAQRHPHWEPVWERRRELELWRRWQTEEEELPILYNRAVIALSNARDLALPGSNELSDAEEKLKKVFLKRHQRVFWGEPQLQPAEIFVGLLKSYGFLGDEIEGGGTVELESDPPGAEVYCFRFEGVEGRLLPLAFDPRLGAVVGRPFLEVEKVWTRFESREGAQPPFEAGDRLLQVGGEVVGLLSDFVDAIKDVADGETVKVRVRRGGEETALAWVPFPAPAVEEGHSPRPRQDLPLPSRVEDIRKQFGFTFAGFPLEFRPQAKVEETRQGSPLRVHLPKGSYLFVFRKDGRVDTRLPVTMPLLPGQGKEPQRVRLLRSEEVPPGFVHVAGGIFACGGEVRRVDQPVDLAYPRVDGFFIAPHEVTFGAYLEFLEAVAPDGQFSPDLPALVPRAESRGGGHADLASFDPARGEWQLRTVSGSWPLYGITQLAAGAYADWLTKKHRAEGRSWRLRLPSDLEWEKAARGVDRRSFVWGNYPILSFCRSYHGIRVQPRRGVVGAFPMDESVYGVRDLAGSVSEMTSSSIRTRTGDSYVSLRGGNWFTRNEDYFFRVANRNGRRADGSGMDTGFRLVAELREE